MPFAFAGSLVQGQATKSAAEKSAAATLEAARIGAEAAKFKPFDIAGSRFATPTYTRDAQGNVIGANLNISPELRAYQDQLSAFGGQQLQEALGAPQQFAPMRTTAGGLFDLSSLYLAQTPEETARKYIESQQSLLAPTRERQLANLRNQVFQTGREGFSIGGTGMRPGGGLGLTASNPEMEAYYNSIATQDAQLAAQADVEGRNRILFGQNLATGAGGLLGGYYAGQINALTPFQTSLGLQGSIESLGMTPLQVGAELGGRSATAGATAGRYLLGGGLTAAETMQKANSFSPLATGLRSISGSAAGNATNRYLEKQIQNLFGTPIAGDQTDYPGYII